MNKIVAWIIAILIAMLGLITVDLYDENTKIKSAYNELYALKEEKRKTFERIDIASQIYQVDPLLLEAIERLETGHYTSEIYHNNNNTWGAKVGDDFIRFPSKLQSTTELARTLKYYYLDAGLDTLEAIEKKYCPNDSQWAEKVKKIYEELENER